MLSPPSDHLTKEVRSQSLKLSEIRARLDNIVSPSGLNLDGIGEESLTGRSRTQPATSFRSSRSIRTAGGGESAAADGAAGSRGEAVLCL